MQIVTLAEGEITELHIGLKGAMNGLFLNDLGMKTHRGQHCRVEKGKAGGDVCHSYRVVTTLDPNGGPTGLQDRLVSSEVIDTARKAVRAAQASHLAGAGRSVLRRSL